MSKSSRRVGIDWGSESHQVCRIDGEEEPKQRRFPHAGEGLTALVDFVVEGEMDREQIAIAIEVNHGAVVEALLTMKSRVYSINPKLLDRLRDRFSLAGAKDDRRDAFVLASCVESDPQRAASPWGMRFGRSISTTRRTLDCERRLGFVEI